MSLDKDAFVWYPRPKGETKEQLAEVKRKAAAASKAADKKPKTAGTGKKTPKA